MDQKLRNIEWTKINTVPPKQDILFLHPEILRLPLLYKKSRTNNEKITLLLTSVFLRSCSSIANLLFEFDVVSKCCNTVTPR